MTLFLILNGTSPHVEIGLFQEKKLLASSSIKNSYTNKLLIPTIDLLLKQENLLFTHLAFVGANQGPGPFTTLRTLLTTVNGLHFASNIPIIGIDSLIGLAHEYENSYKHAPENINLTNTDTNILVLLDAFNNDVYYCIKNKKTDLYQTGYTKIDILLSTLLPTFFELMPFPKTSLDTTPTLKPTIIPDKTSQLINPKKIICIGNAILLHRDKIMTMSAFMGTFEPIFPDPLPLSCSLYHIGITALEQWKSQENSSTKTSATQKLIPLYLKKHAAEL